MAQIIPYQNRAPEIADDVFIAPGARIIGDVSIAAGSSVWYNAVLRGDVNVIRIGRKSNIQDNVTVHCDGGRSGVQGGRGLGTQVGDFVTVGHNCILHACTVEDGCLIGMHAVVMDGAVIGRGAVIGAGALVLMETVIPPFSVAVGSPAKVIKTMEEASYQERLAQAEHYCRLGRAHAQARPL